MSHVEAIYRRGVFEPLGKVDLREEQRVQLSFETAADQTPMVWLEQVRTIQAGITKRRGVLPDSAADIAADRQR